MRHQIFDEGGEVSVLDRHAAQGHAAFGSGHVDLADHAGAG